MLSANNYDDYNNYDIYKLKIWSSIWSIPYIYMFIIIIFCSRILFEFLLLFLPSYIQLEKNTCVRAFIWIYFRTFFFCRIWYIIHRWNKLLAFLFQAIQSDSIKNKQLCKKKRRKMKKKLEINHSLFLNTVYLSRWVKKYLPLKNKDMNLKKKQQNK